jgi:hypothetical protein
MKKLLKLSFAAALLCVMTGCQHGDGLFPSLSMNKCGDGCGLFNKKQDCPCGIQPAPCAPCNTCAPCSSCQGPYMQNSYFDGGFADGGMMMGSAPCNCANKVGPEAVISGPPISNQNPMPMRTGPAVGGGE